MDGKVDPKRPLSTGTDRAKVDALDRPGKVHEFEVPKDKLDQWELSGKAERRIDHDIKTGVTQPEVRINPPTSGEMNKFKKN